MKRAIVHMISSLSNDEMVMAEQLLACRQCEMFYACRNGASFFQEPRRLLEIRDNRWPAIPDPED